MFNKKKPNVENIRNLKIIISEKYNIPENSTLSIAELACHEPNCPPIETIITERNENGKVLKGYKNLVDYKNAMISMTKSNLVDIMLMSASVGEDLVKRNLFKNSSITPAIRMNDTTDIWLMRNGNYRKTNPRPFRSAQMNKVSKLVNLGLFSVTFSNLEKFAKLSYVSLVISSLIKICI